MPVAGQVRKYVHPVEKQKTDVQVFDKQYKFQSTDSSSEVAPEFSELIISKMAQKGKYPEIFQAISVSAAI